MPELIVLVLDDLDKMEEVLNAWLDCGTPGVTIIDSYGLRHGLRQKQAADDLPLMPLLTNLLQGREESHRTLFTIVPDGFEVEALAAATERVTGKLDEPNTGILFTIPISRAWGLNRRQ